MEILLYHKHAALQCVMFMALPDCIIQVVGGTESSGSHSEGGELLHRPGGAASNWGLLAAWKAVWPAAAALFLSVGASMVVAPFFTYVPSSGTAGDLLPQVLFAARTVSDVAGRLVPFAPFLRSKSGLLAAALLRTAITPAFFWCAASLVGIEVLTFASKLTSADNRSRLDYA